MTKSLNSSFKQTKLHGTLTQGQGGQWGAQCDFSDEEWRTLQREVLWLRTVVETPLFEQCIANGVDNGEIVGCPNHDDIVYTDGDYASDIISSIQNGNDVTIICDQLKGLTTAWTNETTQFVFANTLHPTFWNMPAFTGIIAHEIMHAYGFTHNDLLNIRCDAPYTDEGCVNESVERCVRHILQQATALSLNGNIEICGNGGILLPTVSELFAECQYAPYGANAHDIPLVISAIVAANGEIQWRTADSKWSLTTTNSGKWKQLGRLHLKEGTQLEITAVSTQTDSLIVTNATSVVPAGGYIIDRELRVTAYEPSIVHVAAAIPLI